MITNTLKGTYHKGKFELEKPVEFEEKMEVVVIFLKPEKPKASFDPNAFFGLWKDMKVDWEQEIKDMRNLR